MKTRWWLLALAACGGGAKQPTAVIPELPPEAPAPAEPEEPAGDPWAGRTDLLQPPPSAKPEAVKLPPVERFTLPNGLRVMVVTSKDLPIVDMHLAVGVGAQDETRDKRLLAQYTALMLTRGTAKRDAYAIAKTMDFIGGDLGASADLENTHVTCDVLSRDLATCLTLLPEIVINSTFPEGEMPVAANELVAALKSRRDDPGAIAVDHFQNLVWGDDHVRGWPATMEGITAIKRADLVAWHKAHFTPENALLAVAGDVDVKQLREDLTRAFAGWRKRPAVKPKTFKEPAPARRIRLVDKPDLTQAQIVVGHLGVAHGDKDYLPAAIMNQALGGGGFSARLNMVLRVKGGKTYGVSSGFERWRTRGTFSVDLATRTAETVGTLKLLLDELQKMKAGGPTDEELAAAKANVAGSYPGGFQTAADVALAVLAAELHDLGDGWVRDFPLRVNAVDPGSAKAAAAKLLQPDAAAIVIVGKADEIAPQLDAAGLAYERVGYLEPVSPADRKMVKVDAAKAAAGKKILDEALAAKGGAEKLRAIKDLRSVGTIKVTDGGQTFEAEWARLFVAPNRMRLDLKAGGQSLRVTITPETVFQSSGPQSVDMKPDLAAQAREGLWRDHDFILLRHLEAGTRVEVSDPMKVGKVSYPSVTIRKADGSIETRILVDPKTKQIFRLLYKEGGAPGMEEYGDYREVEGVWLPFKQHAETGTQKFDVTVTEHKINGGAPKDAFARP